MQVATEVDFDEFYNATFQRVVGQVFAMTDSLTEAEDAVQEAYARAWQDWQRIGEYENAEAWVRTVAFRVSVSSWRRAKNRFSAHRRGAAAADLPGLTPDRLAIVTALRRISPEQRQAIVLYHLLDCSVEEISREAGVPVGTVKARLARGRKALAPHLTEFQAEPGGSESRARGADGRREPCTGIARKEGTSNV
ncbi:MAG TPA: SigE family RNA polymerase sigma factor [Actinocrinis sp.]|nr:SigE family RNA polymerase sigma factor [Actinocrinis sp.]